MFSKKSDSPTGGWRDTVHRFDRPPWGLWLLWLGLLLAFLLEGGKPDKTWLHTMSNMAIFAGLALGLNIVVGFAGLLDLGFIAFFGIGAYTTAVLTSLMPDAWWWLWALLPVSAGLAAGFGVMLGYPTLRLRGDYLAIVTLGFGEIIRLIFTHFDTLTNGPKGIAGIHPPTVGPWNLGRPLDVGGFTFPAEFLLAVVMLTLVMVLYHIAERLVQTKIGRAWKAIRDDELAAASLGINPSRIKLIAFGTGASFAGICGAFFASFQGFIDPSSFIFFESAMVLSMVVLGGMGSSLGAILGAAVLVAVPVYFQEITVFGTTYQTSEYRMLFMGAVLITLMALRPSGLLGKTAR